MTNEQINIAIEKNIRPSLHGNIYRPTPDYCNDLKAMHEAEKILTGDQLLDYMLNMQSVLVRNPNRDKWTVGRELMHATDRQRAEAFLRTLGKWEGEK
jgi:hypothetical protein